MSKIDDLLSAYRKHLSLPWSDLLSPQEKVWFCIYDPSQERRLRKQMEAFALVTQEAGHDWILSMLRSSLSSFSHPTSITRNTTETPGS